MIVDSHCHAGKGDGLTGPWDTDASIQRYLPRALEAGIRRVVLLPAFHSNYKEANEQLARIVRSRPQLFAGYAMVHPTRDAGRIGDLVRNAVLRDGFCGIKVHRHDGRITREICETARRYRVPVLYDVMGEAASVQLIAREYPTVAFIIPHLGSFGDDWRAHASLIDIMVRFPNVFADTSGVRRFDYLEEAVARAGPRRVLYGSDGPWLHPGLELEKIRALKLPQRAERFITGENWLRLTSRVRRTKPLGKAAVSARSAHLAHAYTQEALDPWSAQQFPRDGGH